MSLIQRYALTALACAAFILAACGGEPPSPAVCWIYDFTSAPVSSNGSPINLISGIWVEGSGIITEGSEITANWAEPFDVTMTAIHVAVARPLGVDGDIDATLVATVFGREINQSNTLPDGVLDGVVSVTMPGAPASGSIVNGLVQIGDGKSLVITSITIELPSGEPSPFPSNPCGPTPPTATPSSTPTGTPTATFTPSLTPTGTLATATPLCNAHYTLASVNYETYWDDGYRLRSNPGPYYYYHWPSSHNFNDPTAPPGGTTRLTLLNPGFVSSVTFGWGRSWTQVPTTGLVQAYAMPGNELLATRTGTQARAQTYTFTESTVVNLETPIHVEYIEFVASGFVVGQGRFGPAVVDTVCGTPPNTPTPTTTPFVICSGNYSAASPHWTGGGVETLTGGTVRYDDDGTATLTLPTGAGGGSVNVVWRREASLGTSGNVSVYAQPSNTLLMELSETLAASTIPALEPLVMGAALPDELTESIEFVFDDMDGIYGPQQVIVNCLPPPTPISTVAPPTPTATGIGVSTSTAQPTNTPLGTLPPTPTQTDTPTCPGCFVTLPPDTATPAATSTRVPLPTPVYTTTRWPTLPGPALTPIPGGTAVFSTRVVTPSAGTLASTPIRRGTALPVPGDLGEHRPGIRDYLGTAVGYVNELPRDIGGIAPSISGTFPIFAGYAKWAMSSTSLQEIFGQRIYPIPQHLFYGVTVMILVAVISLTFKIVLFFVKLALWIVRFILKIIPFIG